MWRRGVGYVLSFSLAVVVGEISMFRFSRDVLDRLFPSVHRDWPAGWVALLVLIAAAGSGIYLMWRREILLGVVIFGLSAGGVGTVAFQLLLLHTLPSC